MELVINTNIVFSALVRDSLTRFLICNPTLVLYAPETMISELEKHEEEILKRSGLSKDGWGKLTSILFSNVRLVSKEKIAPFLKKALEFSPDPEDAPFFALCLFKGISLWSNDKALKRQSMVKVFSTEEIINILGLK